MTDPGIVWLVAREASSLPEPTRWLGPTEVEVLAALSRPWRRADWLLGRFAAKEALRAVVDEPPAPERFEILAASDGAPEAWLDGERLPWVISLSHRDGVAICAVAPAGVALGCDLERVEPRSAAFVEDYFTAAERDRIVNTPNEGRDALVNALWAAKEAALKALRTGLRRDTRSVEVTHVGEGEGWRALRVEDGIGARAFGGLFRLDGGRVVTVLGDPPVLDVRAIDTSPG